VTLVLLCSFISILYVLHKYTINEITITRDHISDTHFFQMTLCIDWTTPIKDLENVSDDFEKGIYESGLVVVKDACTLVARVLSFLLTQESRKQNVMQRLLLYKKCFDVSLLLNRILINNNHNKRLPATLRLQCETLIKKCEEEKIRLLKTHETEIRLL
jgi:hypothetical protein